MRTSITLALLVLIVGCGSPRPAAPAASTPPPSAPAGVSFAKDIRPILAANCLGCHDGTPSAKSKYDLSKYDGVMTKIVPGQPDSSRLFTMLDQGRMPPGGRLEAARIASVRNWIAEGAKNN